MAFALLLDRWESIVKTARSLAVDACLNHPQLRDAIVCILDSDSSQWNPYRLVPLVMLDALTGDPSPAEPICVLSRLWWAGAETFDDLTDGKFDSETAGIPLTSATIASIACMSLLPQAIISRHGFPEPLERALLSELVSTSLDAASGQLADLSPSVDGYSWKQSMRGYVGKCGAPYARDLAMTGLIAGTDTEHMVGLRLFGKLFGVLRQLANDRAEVDPAEDEDLANGVHTLLIAHAATVLPDAERAALIALHVRARDNVDDRRDLMNRLRAPDIATGYNRRIDDLHGLTSTLLEQLVDPTEWRDLIQWMINGSAMTAKLVPLVGAA